jgi:hypothetical protein
MKYSDSQFYSWYEDLQLAVKNKNKKEILRLYDLYEDIDNTEEDNYCEEFSEIITDANLLLYG